MAPCMRRQNLKNATLMGPVVPSTNTGTPVRPVSKKKKKNKEADQPTVTLPRLTIKMPPLVGVVAAAVATGSASVALGKRTLSPEDGHEQGRATSGHATKKRHVKDDKEDVSQSNVPSVRKLKRNDSSDEECMVPLTQVVIQKMELEASNTTGSDQGNTQGGTPKGMSFSLASDIPVPLIQSRLFAGYTQEDYSRVGHPWEDYSLAGYSQAQEDYLQVGYSQEDNWQAGHSQEDDWQAGHSQEDDGQAGHSQEDYSQVGSYTLFDPEATGAASKDNGAARAHFEATLVHSEAMPVRSKAIHPHSEAMYGHPDATHSRTEAVHGRSEATCSRSEAMHGHSEATHSHTEAVHSHSKATHSHSEVTHFHSKVTHAEVTHTYSEATPKALHTCSRAAPAHSVTTPSHPEGSQGTHLGSAASNGHRTTPAHSNSRQVSEPIASFPHLRASIMIYNAFPDAALIGTFVLRAFLAATSHNLHTVHVHQCILHDHVYLSKMIMLVKERCVAAVALLINVNDSPTLIADLIDRQLNDNYNYIFPRRSNVLYHLLHSTGISSQTSQELMELLLMRFQSQCLP
ncbi:hypothetical protein EDB85DRAFT_1904251 [Lactarius pseudohatsudake]|nr:hypothetical protein EDB85DRAFT_1904251 [Lactarius pseudohatsudake]